MERIGRAARVACSVAVCGGLLLAADLAAAQEESGAIVVTGEEIRLMKANKMADVLNHVPGVTAGDSSVGIHGSYKVKVLVDDLLYSMSEQAVLKCTEATTGTLVWSQKLKGDFWSSPLAAPGRIYLSNKKGATTVFAPGREYKELAVNTLDGEFWASPAVAGKSVLLRSKTHLYRIEESK